MKVYKLVDDNLLIREITEKDIELIRKWRNQADIRQYFIDNNYIDKNQQKEWLKKYSQKKDDIMFVIEETLEFKKAIGTVALYNIDSKNNSVEFGRLMIGYLPC
ncbi:GNAT family N-acetyltransferase [Bacillus wiedmannii]|uniref:GNAT family N-acetyltransferase n=1 Tax=Bacillus wiedmannii TaxID=1890302 RepID=UPI001680B001|nr:GNAT family N-acetyltransferase [Bacillus wiedmannii]